MCLGSHQVPTPGPGRGFSRRKVAGGAATGRTAAAIAGAAVLAGCTGPLSTLDAAGPAAASIATLWWVMLAGAAVLFLLVMALLGIAFMKHAAGPRLPAWFWLAGGGLVLPALVLTPLILYAIWSGDRLVLHAGTDAPLRIEVTARQWQWDIAYPEAAGRARTSVNVLHIPAGRTVELLITSADVIHSFWVPRLAGKIDAIPGHINTLRLEAAAPGLYRGVCAEFCGVEHAGMNFAVEAHDAADYVAQLERLDGPQAAADAKPAGPAL